LAIGDRRVGRVAVQRLIGAIHWLRQWRLKIARPELLARETIQAHEMPLEIFLLARLLLVKPVAAVRGDDDLVSDDDRAATTRAGHGRFPRDIAIGTPGNRRVFIRRDAQAAGAAKLQPVGVGQIDRSSKYDNRSKKK